MYIIIVIVIIVIIMLYFLISCFGETNDLDGMTTKKVKSMNTKKKGKAVKKYQEVSGHNMTKAVVDALSAIEKVKAKNASERVEKSIMLRNLNKYNLQRLDEAERHENIIAYEVLNNPMDTIDHINFVTDNILPPLVSNVIKNTVVDTRPLDERITWHVDNQSTHDTSVNDSVRTIINKLDILTDSKRGLEKVDEIYKLGNEKVNKVLDKIMSNTTFKKDGKTEAQLLGMVLDKADNKEKLDNVISSLEDSHENGAVTCTTGRINRFMASLSHIDDDVGVPVVTKEFVRNEIFNTASNILKDELKQLSDTTRKDYEEAKDTPEVQAFETSVKQKIADNVKSTYSHLEGQNTNLEQIIIEAQSGV